MRTLVLDTESTIYASGNPFSEPNKLMCVGLYDGFCYTYLDIERSLKPFKPRLDFLSQVLSQTELLVGHNLKYDLHWLRRYGIQPPEGIVIWDTQLAEYILSDQRWVMPSLDEACKRVGIPGKTDSLASKYWDQGINTTEIPEEELRNYNEGDCRATWALFQNQKGRLAATTKGPLFALHCDDLLVLQEMEFNGIKWNEEGLVHALADTSSKHQVVTNALKEFDPHNLVNWGSNDHLSCVLYGGKIAYRVREKIIKHYKKGDTEVERWGTAYQEYPRLVAPLEGTEREKDGLFLVNEGVLKSLPAKGKAKELIKLVLEEAELSKLLDTYLIGIPKLMEEMQWTDSLIHGQFNQCVTRTGRSSSSKPNEQNFSEPVKELIVSRYAS